MSTENEVILSLQNVTKRYPGVTALDHVSMEFRKGEVHALLGENGAGKSTLIKTITGANSIDEGSIVFEGTKYAGLTTSLSRDIGISAVYQESNLIRQMTVADNIFLGDYATHNYFTDDAAMKKKAKEVLASLGFHIDPGTKALVLTAAQQQIIEIARPLVRNLKLIIFDEPTSALSSAEADQLFEIIEMLKKKGITVIYITHRIEELFRIADRVSIMRDGCYIDTVNIKDVKRDTLISLMVGREFVESYPKPKGNPGEVIMEAKHLEGDKFHDISFQVRAGEILGFAGLVGSGRTETARGVFGADRLKAGEVYIKGKKVTSRTPKEGIRNGIGYIPEERKLSLIHI